MCVRVCVMVCVRVCVHAWIGIKNKAASNNLADIPHLILFSSSPIPTSLSMAKDCLWEI